MHYTLLDPKRDYIFKRIFGSKGNEPILMSLLNAILKGNPTIKEITLINTELPQEERFSKGCRFDILAKTSENVMINIEMQYRNNKNIEERILYYSDRLFVNEYKAGDKYIGKKIISIWIFAENATDRADAISEVIPMYKRGIYSPSEPFNECKRIIIIELNKYHIDREMKDIFSNWVTFFREPDSLDSLDNSDIENNGLGKAMSILEYISQDEKEKQIAIAYSDFQDDNERDKKILIEEGIKQGLKQGKEEGEKQGLKKGLKEGLKQGKEEGKKEKAKEMARNMLKDKVDINTISKYTGLTIEEIEFLTNNQE